MSILTAIDHTHTTRKILAMGEGSWAAMAESHLVYDPRFMWNTWLITRFFDALKAELEGADSIELGRDGVLRAVKHALQLQVPSGHGAKYLTFSVLLGRQAGWWVYNLGTNLVLHLSEGAGRIVVPPHSALEQRRLEGGPMSERDWHAVTIPTVLADEGTQWEGAIQSAQVTMKSGEWLLATPASEAGYTLQLDQMPDDQSDLERVIDKLAKPFAVYSRTWLAVKA